MPYIGGVGVYRQECDDIVADNYRGFVMRERAGARLGLTGTIRCRPTYRFGGRGVAGFAMEERCGDAVSAPTCNRRSASTVTGDSPTVVVR